MEIGRAIRTMLAGQIIRWDRSALKALGVSAVMQLGFVGPRICCSQSFAQRWARQVVATGALFAMYITSAANRVDPASRRGGGAR